jgi:hypothetical protein
VADSACEPRIRKQREAELTAALKEFVTKYQKLANSVHGANWHVHFVKVLKDNMSAVNVNSTANANNAINVITAANVNSTANANSTAIVLRGNVVNTNNAVNAANINSTAMVNTNNAVNANNANNVNTTTTTTTNNNAKRPAEAMDQDGNNGDASNASKRVKTEDALETTFKVVTNYANTDYTAQVYHGGNKSHEFMLNGPAVVQVYTGAGTPAFAQPAVPATSTSANGTKADGYGDPSARPVPLDMYL